jgi:hypothetical protein
MEKAQTQPKFSEDIIFEKVWATLDRITERQEETAHRQEATDLRMMETARRQEETARRQEETDRQMKETDRRIGKLGNRFGEVVEYMVAPNLCEKFREFDLIFPKANSGTRVSDHKNNIHFEIDIMLENGSIAMLVEAKTKLTTEHVNEHIERLEKMRKYADLHGDKRSFLGAVAGVVLTSNVKDYALKHGFFAIEPSGETFNIIPPNGKPKEW